MQAADSTAGTHFMRDPGADGDNHEHVSVNHQSQYNHRLLLDESREEGKRSGRAKVAFKSRHPC